MSCEVNPIGGSVSEYNLLRRSRIDEFLSLHSCGFIRLCSSFSQGVNAPVNIGIII
jgi:hypothetical protein